MPSGASASRDARSVSYEPRMVSPRTTPWSATASIVGCGAVLTTPLVTSGVVNTAPQPTIEAVADHGVVRGDTIRGSYDTDRASLDALAPLGIDYDDVVRVLEEEGIDKFAVSWHELTDLVASRLTK